MSALDFSERLTEHTRIAAAPDELWAFLCRPTWENWVEGTLVVRQPSGQAALGMTYRETNRLLGPIRVRTRWQVVEFEAPRRQRHTGSGLPGIEAFAVEWALTEDPVGTRIAMSFDVRPAGAAGRLVYRLALRARLQQSLRASLAALRVAMSRP